MDFFEHQDVARRKTGLLVVYFCLAVILIVAGIYLAATAIFNFVESKSDPGRQSTFELWEPNLFAFVAVATVGVIAIGSLYRTAILSSGGAVVAETLGGTPVNPNTRKLEERIVLNVVEEMAIASGTPVPQVYLMEDEEGINAFAAGYSPDDAVIGVTKGCTQMLSREELQGVIAHEFSHILNGDMRLNIRLIGIIYGILVIAQTGFVLIRVLGISSRRSRGNRDKGGGALIAVFLFGLALWIIGYVGVFFGKLIKSAVSRQREFLADASAVQFTRNPSGLSGALKKIGGMARGARIECSQAEQASHMFFGNALSTSWLNLMSTHPPLDIRIRKIEPSFEGEYPQVVPLQRTKADLRPMGQKSEQAIHGRRAAATSAESRRHSFSFQASQVLSGIGAPGPEHFIYAAALIEVMPKRIVELVHEPFGARAVIYSLLLDADPEMRELQMKRLAEHAASIDFQETQKLLPLLDQISSEMRLPLVEMALPALKYMSPNQYHSFKQNVVHLVRADEEIRSFEYVLHRVLLIHLDPCFKKRKPPTIKYRSMQPLLRDCSALLSFLAHTGQTNASATVRAFDQAASILTSQSAKPAFFSKAQIGLKDVDCALNRLAAAVPQVKKRVLSACAVCIEADGKTTVEEGELLRMIADSLNCPMPPLLAESS